MIQSLINSSVSKHNCTGFQPLNIGAFEETCHIETIRVA